MKKEVSANQKYYDKNARSWADRRTNIFTLEKIFIKYYKFFKKDAAVLDIGCAAGASVPLFLGIGRHLQYEGMDLSSKLISIARRRYPQLKFQVGDITNAKTLPNKKFSGFWAVAVLMHIHENDWPKMLANISKISKPGAIGFIMLPAERPNEKSKIDQRFFSYWDKNKLKRFTDQAGWRIIDSDKLKANKLFNNQGKWSWYLVKLP